MTEFLVVSNVLLWIGFVAMVLVNFALARQIGVLYERVAPAGALMMNKTVSVGNAAPVLDVMTLDKETLTIGRPAQGRSQLVFFLSPDCPVCSELTPALVSAARSESRWLDLVIASDGNEHDHPAYRLRKNLLAFPYVVSEVLGKSYGVSKLPYAVLIDEQGLIASMGIINSREHLDSLFEAKERKVTSIQEFMKQKSAVEYVEADK